MNIFELKKNSLTTGRAATAISIILSSNGIRGKKVIVPANLCYAAIYPVIYTGNTPLFCDVDPLTGNITDKIFEKAVSEAPEGMAAAAVIPHMYGKCIPRDVISKIRNICDRENILMIEDCASALGASNGDYTAGSSGDYSVFSFGYSKTVDIGKGGLILTDRDINDLKEEYLSLPQQSEEDRKNEAFFSKLYRLIRNNPDQTLDSNIWAGIEGKVRTVFVSRSEDKDLEEKIYKACKDPDDLITRRREEAKLYQKLIRSDGDITHYVYDEGDVPWRYSIFTSPGQRRGIIDHLLSRNIPVSDWYPCVTPIFGIKGTDPNGDPLFPGVSYMEERILNFPLPAGEEEIRRIAEALDLYRRDDRNNG
ncbi:MAG: DegT/DnrJ/EryC1/StrS family aminotransferase [Clostridiales bacterium]|nr:DegT/DnrJ/EryC1/StrS family aminotransferase [Clostridiales bacterium]